MKNKWYESIAHCFYHGLERYPLLKERDTGFARVRARLSNDQFHLERILCKYSVDASHAASRRSEFLPLADHPVLVHLRSVVRWGSPNPEQLVYRLSKPRLDGALRFA